MAGVPETTTGTRTTCKAAGAPPPTVYHVVTLLVLVKEEDSFPSGKVCPHKCPLTNTKEMSSACCIYLSNRLSRTYIARTIRRLKCQSMQRPETDPVSEEGAVSGVTEARERV